MTDFSHVAVLRGGHAESRHRVHVAVVDAGGSLLSGAGDPDFMTFARSAVKPIQALPLIDDGVADAFGFSAQDLALCCASHSGEPKHVAIAAGILSRIGAREGDLACGPHEPFDRTAARALRDGGAEPGRLHNNCSGKHAGMMALAKHHGWPIKGYHELQHPVQRRMALEIAQWSGIPVDALLTGVDGCGVATFGLPLYGLALSFARLSDAHKSGGGGPARVVDAMLRHPDIVAGTNRMCTELMHATGSRIFAKVGAEGVYCAGIPAAGVGVAVKIEDGAQRAAEPALLAVLRELGYLAASEAAGLDRWVNARVKNTRGEVVGAVEARIVLEGRA